MNFLYAAYAATWAIHIAYLVTLGLRYARLKREIEDMGRKGR
jgi:CcmD family protein